MPDALLDHYRLRAPTYEAIYFRPDESRIVELERLAADLRAWLRGRDVLEIACGTGWWTVHAAATAKSVVATDGNEVMLDLARQKPLDTVRFAVAEAYDLKKLDGEFGAAFACFWLSHVPRARLAEFLSGLVDRLGPRARVVLADNVFDPETGGRFVESPDSNDTYRARPNPEGGEDLVLKNYFSAEELGELVRGMHNVTVTYGRRYWWVRFETPERA